jgi:hypothetical protein
MDQPSKAVATDRMKVRRRTLISTGGLVAAGALVAGAPLAYKFGRRQLAIELANLEGVGIDAAAAAADATYEAVMLIVIPIADVLSNLSAESLDNAASAMDEVINLVGATGTNTDALKALHTILADWRTNVTLFPATIQSLNAVERDAGKKYLAQLKAKRLQEAQNL